MISHYSCTIKPVMCIKKVNDLNHNIPLNNPQATQRKNAKEVGTCDINNNNNSKKSYLDYFLELFQ